MKQIFDHIVSSLQPVYSLSEARELAFWVIEETTGLTRTDVLCGKDTQNISNIEIILQRLCKKEPIEYIFGHCLWSGLDLLVNSATLIPRPETAELVTLITRQITTPHLRVLDIGTGSGCIALALQQAQPTWQITGVDVSEKALQVAQQNAVRNHLPVTFEYRDILADEIDNFDIIVSNPPYVTASEKNAMDSNVLDFEPHTALFVPDDNPLLFYRRIAELRKATHLFFEINERFGAAMIQLLRACHYTDIHLYQDQYGKDRFVYGRIEA